MATKSNTITRKASGSKVDAPKTETMSAKVDNFQAKGEENERASARARIAPLLTPMVNGGIELLDITSIQKTIQSAAIEYINFLANEGGLAANLFLGWTTKNKKRIAVIVGKSSCRIWASDSIESWVDASDQDVVIFHVSEKSLRLGGEAILSDIGHGVTHIYNAIVGDDDTSDNGRHLGQFKQTAKKFGFEVKEVQTNKKFILNGLNPAGKIFLDSMKTDWTGIIAWAKKSDPSSSANSSESKTGAAARTKARNDKAAEAKKTNAKNSSKYESLMKRVSRRYCKVSSHHSQHGEVWVQNDKVAVCPASTSKTDPSKRCLKVMTAKK